MTDVIVSQAEMASAVNKIEYYIDFLSTCVTEYREILLELSSLGIRDEKIKASLYDLERQVDGFLLKFPDFCETAKGSLNGFLKEVESADNFAYPYTKLDQIKIILSQFLQ